MKTLNDSKKNGKQRPWKLHKHENEMILRAFDMLGQEMRAFRMAACGQCLQFSECDEHGIKKLKHANFCRERLCPMCAWRRSLKTSQQVHDVSHAVFREHPKWKYLLLTLTVPNCPGSDLHQTTTKILKSFKSLMDLKEVKAGVRGYFRSLEVTYNLETKQYHPHLHVMLLVTQSYFTSDYIKHARWLELWQKLTKDSSITQVDIRRMRTKGKSLETASAELSKYLTKFSSFIETVDQKELIEIVKTLHESMSGRRLQQYGGVLKKLHYDLHLADLEEPTNEDFIGEGDGDTKCPQCDLKMAVISYFWTGHDYLKNEKLLRVA
jgi:plasmid rolling circle replication initiator protein Rep